MKIHDIEEAVKLTGRSGRKTYKLLDLISVSLNPNKNGLLKYNTASLRSKTELGNAGIYIWSHPDFGIFYIGINSKGVDGLEQRWLAHIDKLVNRLRVGTGYTHGWHEFSKMFIKHSTEDVSKVNDDLAEVRLTYIPLANPKDYADRRQLKKELADIEDRLIDKILPFANKEYRFSRNQNRLQYSKTRLPADYIKPTSDQPPTRPIRTMQPRTIPTPKANSLAVINQAKELKSQLQSLPNQNRTIQSTIDNLDTIINNKKISRSQDQVAPVIVSRVQDLVNRYQ
jgi:hypothetical protein